MFLSFSLCRCIYYNKDDCATNAHKIPSRCIGTLRKSHNKDEAVLHQIYRLPCRRIRCAFEGFLRGRVAAP